MNDKLLILDIDETLLFASQQALDQKHDFLAEHYFVYKRPYLEEFLEFAFNNFKVAIWTSSNELYANHIVKQIITSPDALEFVWARSKCVAKFNPETWEHDYIKDLKKAKKNGYNLKDMIMVDDTPKKLRRNYGNLVRVTPFMGDQRDEELLDLATYLEQLKGEKNIRKVEKRGWKNRIEM